MQPRSYKVMKLIIVNPAVNALSEGSSSALCQIKTWLRRRKQARLHDPSFPRLTTSIINIAMNLFNVIVVGCIIKKHML